MAPGDRMAFWFERQQRLAPNRDRMCREPGRRESHVDGGRGFASASGVGDVMDPRSLAVIGGLILAAGVLSLYRHAAVGEPGAAQGQASRGDGGRSRVRLSDDIERFEAAARLGIGLASTGAGLYAGTWVADLLSEARDQSGGLAKLAAASLVIGLTAAVLLLGDLLPRRIAAHRPTRIAACWPDP